jgi:hypothetical protein
MSIFTSVKTSGAATCPASPRSSSVPRETSAGVAACACAAAMNTARASTALTKAPVATLSSSNRPSVLHSRRMAGAPAGGPSFVLTSRSSPFADSNRRRFGYPETAAAGVAPSQLSIEPGDRGAGGAG